MEAAIKARVGYAGEVAGQRLADVPHDALVRRGTGIGELDRVLGGGLVPGSVVLLGGDPGIGKSTLLLQTCVINSERGRTLYVSGEESLHQIAMRARRLGIDVAALTVLAATRVEEIIALASRERPGVLIVDSVQTVYTDQLPTAPGSVNQLRECTSRLVRMAKETGIAVLLVGHVTKEGQIAGPRVLEHMVDVVLYFESDAGNRYRMLRAVKNRFGAANELGVFAMTESGMREVKNPSAIFLSARNLAVAGRVVTAIHQGSRPLLVEVQALTDRSGSAAPRRVTVGLDPNRLSLLLAVLHRHCGIRVHDEDVFLNVVGGVRIAGTSADLPAMIATVSSLNNLPVPSNVVAFGEVGLAGEARPVAYGEERLREAAKLGFRCGIIPKGNRLRESIEGLEIIVVDTLREALDAVESLASKSSG
jgi:DNA repair protein RadA/Sms